MLATLFFLAVSQPAAAQDWVKPPEPSPFTGDVFVPGPAGANILLDGQPTGLLAPATLERVATGAHVVGLRRECDGVDIPIDVRAGAIERAEGSLARGPASIAIGVSVDGAAVWLDGMSLGQAPVAIQHTTCGAHVVEAEAPGYARATAEVKLNYGESLPYTLTLSAIEAGNVAVNVRPFDAEVFIDGTRRGSGPLTVNGLPAGLHQVVAKAKGYEPGQVPVTVKGGETARVDLSLLPAKSFVERTGLDRVDWPRVGVGAGLGAVAAASGALAATQFLAADAGYAGYLALDYSQQPDVFYDEYVQRPTVLAYGLTGLGVVSAGTSAVLFATLRPRDVPGVVPVVTPTGAGVGGTF